jgi:Acetyltransferases
MGIELKDIDQSNWEACVLLTTNKENKHYIGEEFIASNVYSIAQAKIEKGWVIKAVYAEGIMVGFTMYGYCYDDQFYEIARLMVDHKYQGKGYGRATLAKVIEVMKNSYDFDKLYISFDPKNQIAKRLYESFHFQDTGKMIEGEQLYCLYF